MDSQLLVKRGLTPQLKHFVYVCECTCYHVHIFFGFTSKCIIHSYIQRTISTKCPRAPVLFIISLLMTVCLFLFATTVNENSSEVEQCTHTHTHTH